MRVAGNERTTVLTGVTGFVGRELLVGLLAQPRERVVALVRDGKDGAAESRVAQLLHRLHPDPEARADARRRVAVVGADLDRDDAQLRRRVLEAVGGRRSRVIHGAASVSFDLPLAAARNTNVAGTRRMLEIAGALAREGSFERFAYVSTAFVAGMRSGRVLENELDVGQRFTNTYEQTKLEAERLVREHAGQLPVTVFRPSIVAGRSESGETSSFKVLYWPLKVLARRLVPCIPGDPEAVFDIVPVDFVAEALLHVLESEASCGGCYHLSAGDAVVTLDRLVKVSAEMFGLRRVPPYVSPRRFYMLLRPFLLLVRIGPARRVVIVGDVYIPYLSKKLVFDNRATVAALRSSKIRLPDVEAYLKTILRYAKDTDFGRHTAGA